MKTILLISPYWKEPHRWMVSTVKLAELWRRLGYNVVVACMGTETKTERIAEHLTVYFRKDFFLKDPWNYGIALGFSGFVMRLVKNEKPDLIVINKLLFWTSLAGLRLRLAGRRYLLLTDAFVGMTWWPRGLLPRIGAFLYAWTLGWLILLCAERVVTFHSQPSSLLRRLGIAGKTRVIPTGLDPSFHIPRVHHQDPRVIITYVGRLESVKGVEDFLAALTPLLRDHSDLRIQVAGWFRDPHPLVERYRHHVSFLGLREDVPQILTESDIFVLPSYSEGLSNALMEAMASGCACVASDVGGNRFLVQNGVSGFLFPAGDREALAAHVRRLILDPAKRAAIGAAARKRIEEHFSWEKVGEEYRRLFEGQIDN
ncbi:MAG: glycosyltransferase family 4 protein [Candidatus Peribacteraceae bacterium]|nr:glycosyltransferase family 4 protein [Candidatus Peribacteraceae bacterium]